MVAVVRALLRFGELQGGNGVSEAIRKLAIRALFPALVVLVAACSANPTKLRVSLRAEEGANQNAPIAVSVLVVYDENVFTELSRLSAGEWFAQAAQYMKDNPDSISFDVVQWELMPGQEIKETKISLQDRPSKGLVFADYYAGGRHRARFRPGRRILMLLGKSGFDVVDLDD
jgi:hypothetical protein